MELCYDIMQMIGTQVEQTRSLQDHKNKLNQVLEQFMVAELEGTEQPFSGMVEYGSYLQDDYLCNLLQSEEFCIDPKYDGSVYGRVFYC